MGHPCYKCGELLEKHIGQHGQYLRCSGYPACDVTQRLYNGRPVGFQADKELREIRKAGHAMLFKIKCLYNMDTPESYAWLAGRLRLPVEECHFGLFEQEMCHEALDIMNHEIDEEDPT